MASPKRKGAEGEKIYEVEKSHSSLSCVYRCMRTCFCTGAIGYIIASNHHTMVLSSPSPFPPTGRGAQINRQPRGTPIKNTSPALGILSYDANSAKHNAAIMHAIARNCHRLPLMDTMHGPCFPLRLWSPVVPLVGHPIFRLAFHT